MFHIERGSRNAITTTTTTTTTTITTTTIIIIIIIIIIYIIIIIITFEADTLLPGLRGDGERKPEGQV